MEGGSVGQNTGCSLVLLGPHASDGSVGIRRGGPFRTIAALELLGTLVKLVVPMPVVERKSDASGVIILTCSIDSQGNSFLLDKLLNTRYPLSIIFMDLAH